MAETLIIPLEGSNDLYDFSIEIENQNVEINIRWNGTDQAYYMALKGITFETEVKGIRLVGGTNLLKPYAISQLGGIFIIDTNDDKSDPTYESLGDLHKMMYVTIADMETTFNAFL